NPTHNSPISGANPATSGNNLNAKTYAVELLRLTNHRAAFPGARGAEVLFEAGLGEGGLQGNGIVAGEAGEAEGVALHFGGGNHALQAEIPKVTEAQEIPNSLDLLLGGD